MPGLDDLLNFVLRAVDVAPRYESANCTAVRRSPKACQICVDVCPHQAVSLKQRVEIDKVDCTGCGICVQECPTGALATRVVADAGSVRCSQVPGDAQSVLCLARLEASEMVRLAGTASELTLAHAACADCPIGSAKVPALVAREARLAERILAVAGREVTISVTEHQRFDHRSPGGKLSRRSLFRGAVRSARNTSAEALEPLERLLPGASGPAGLPPMPAEHARRLDYLAAAAPESQTLVPWRLPKVDDGCILCPYCTRACPTGAFSRELGGELASDRSDGSLMLDPERCIGCDVCVDACPVGVISMEDTVTAGEVLGGPIVAYNSARSSGAPGTLSR